MSDSPGTTPATPVRFGVIADDITILPALEALLQTPGTQVLAAWAPQGPLRDALSARLPHILIPVHWDEMFLSTDLDRLLIAGASSDLLSAAKRFIAHQKLLVVATDLTAGPRPLFEYFAIWNEAPDKVRPLFFSGLRLAAEHAFATLQQQGEGALRKLELQRTIPADPPGARGLATTYLDRWLLQDLDWIVRLAGWPRQVTMLASGQSEGRFDEVTVLLNRSEGPEVRWTIRAANTAPSWRLILSGASNDVTVTDEDRRHGSSLQQDLQSQFESLRREPESETVWNCSDVLRFGEIGAAAHRSLARRRTIDIHFEEASERSQFKSQMTAIGCGAMLWALFGTIALLTLAAIADPRDREYRAAASAGFLLLDEDFQADALTPHGEVKLKGIAERWSSTSPVLVVERAVESDSSATRGAAVAGALANWGIRDPQNQIVVRPLSGRWFEPVLIVGWLAVFLPIGLFLLLQLLIAIARPAQPSSGANP